MATNANLIGGYRIEAASFAPEFGTRPRRIWRAPTASATSGSRVHAITVSNNTGSTKNVDLMVGKSLTAFTAALTGSPTITGQNVLNRTVGSFVTDGWRVGDRVYLMGATTIGNDAIATITAVAATTLTFAASTFSVNESLPITAELVRVSQLYRMAIPNNAGWVDGSPSYPLLHSGYMPAIDPSPGRFLTLGAGDLLLAKLDAAVSAGTNVDVTTFGGDY